jgi:20S proteasome alpha/beta subunit
MSQIVACRTDTGIILAADSKALDVNPKNEIVELKVNRVLQLTSNTAIVTGGATEGENMGRALRDFISEEKLTDIDEVYKAALPFLGSEYEKFMRKKCAFWPIDPIHQVYFILGGYSRKSDQKPFQLYLLWTKMKLPQLDGDEISSTYSVPRLIRLEYRLNQLSKESK